jgi:hypothetical protein
MVPPPLPARKLPCETNSTVGRVPGKVEARVEARVDGRVPPVFVTSVNVTFARTVLVILASVEMSTKPSASAREWPLVSSRGRSTLKDWGPDELTKVTPVMLSSSAAEKVSVPLKTTVSPRIWVDCPVARDTAALFATPCATSRFRRIDISTRLRSRIPEYEKVFLVIHLPRYVVALVIF